MRGCKLCKRRHNTLIHVTDPKSIISSVGTENNSTTTSPPPPLPSTSLQTDKSNAALSTLTCSQMQHKEYRDVWLSTALLKSSHHNNNEDVFRAVLDSGSTLCFITENACSKQFTNKEHRYFYNGH